MPTADTENNEAVIETLLSFSLFEGFTSHGVSRLVVAGEVVKADPGHLFCSEGDEAGDVVLVLSGQLEVFVNRDGKDISIAGVEAGAILGEIALLSELPRSASVRSKTEVMLLTWSGKVFRRLLFSDAGFARRIFRASLRAVIDGEKRMITKRVDGVE